MKGDAPLETPERFCKTPGFTAFLLRRQASKPGAIAEPLRTADRFVVSSEYSHLASEAAGLRKFGQNPRSAYKRNRQSRSC